MFDGRMETFSPPFRYVWPSELDLMAQLAGMTLRDRWGDWNRSPFTGEYKQRILAEADSATALPGGVGALLRREGLYSSHLTTWRRERQAGILKGLTPNKRGPKPKRNPQEEEMQKLRRENQRLTEELRKAAIVIDVQKKVGALLGWPLPKADPEEQS